jgi:RNA-directed DNA polymerase
MTARKISNAGASSANANWNAIEWQPIVASVRRLQMRIAKAYREGRYGKAKVLQRLLTTSYHAKLLAVRRVVQNKGAKTPGVDGVTWSTQQQKMEAAQSLRRRGYRTKPLKRIYIKKKQKGTFRPLSIPVMRCRAQQSLYLLALEPIAETMADKNSYGFRPLRSTHDAISQCFQALCHKNSSEYILEGDIKACFDSISKTWLLNNVPMDKLMLTKWLDAGYIENERWYPTEQGTPQGGIISPALLVITLSGLEAAAKAGMKRSDHVNVCSYADDFIITGASRELLEQRVKPAVVAFLKERGLTLSEEKTKITHINEGFDFLGVNVRKYNGVCIIKPAKNSVKRFLTDIRKEIKKHRTSKTDDLIWRLNQKIGGWTNYYRHVCSKRAFSYVDSHIFHSLWHWCLKRHPNKGKRWIKAKYYQQTAFRSWIFFAKVKNKNEEPTIVRLKDAVKTPIIRHVKLKAEATPYDPAHREYLSERLRKRLQEKKTSRRPKWELLWGETLKLKDNKLGHKKVAL